MGVLGRHVIAGAATPDHGPDHATAGCGHHSAHHAHQKGRGNVEVNLSVNQMSAAEPEADEDALKTGFF